MCAFISELKRHPSGEVVFPAAEGKKLWGNNTGVGLLRLRLDGWVAVVTETSTWTANLDDMPSFVTVPLLVPEPPAACRSSGDGSCELTLRVNFETAVAGSVAVELRQGGRPLPGFKLSLAEHMYGNWISRAARWRNSTKPCSVSTPCNNQALDQAMLAGKLVQIAIVMQDARLYSLAFEYRQSKREQAPSGTRPS
jgi:hypothetical protein